MEHGLGWEKVVKYPPIAHKKCCLAEFINIHKM